MKRLNTVIVSVVLIGVGILSVVSLLRVEAVTNTIVHSFRGNSQFDGATPLGSLLQSDTGVLYGTTKEGGAGNWGTIFSYNPSTKEYLTLYSFADTVNGMYPIGSLAINSEGSTLYGVATEGGLYGKGVLFSYAINDGTQTVLVNFGDPVELDGEYPYGTPAFVDGVLYGTTKEGGASGNGAIFSYNTLDSTYATIASFDGQTTGQYPNYGLTASDGLLFGTTTSGGSSGKGTAFSFNPQSLELVKIGDFGSGEVSGEVPSGPLVDDGRKLYGVTRNGGEHNTGTIFSLTRSSLSTLYEFTDLDGDYPEGSLASVGEMLYGVTSSGGTNGYGTVFLYDKDGGILTTVLSFDRMNGAAPSGGLVYAVDELLYGVTSQGGRGFRSS